MVFNKLKNIFREEIKKGNAHQNIYMAQTFSHELSKLAIG